MLQVLSWMYVSFVKCKFNTARLFFLCSLNSFVIHKFCYICRSIRSQSLSVVCSYSGWSDLLWVEVGWGNAEGLLRSLKFTPTRCSLPPTGVTSRRVRVCGRPHFPERTKIGNNTCVGVQCMCRALCNSHVFQVRKYKGSISAQLCRTCD